MKKVNKFIQGLCLIAITSPAMGEHDMSENVDLSLHDGRELSLRNVGDIACFELSLRTNANKYLWDRTYCTDFDLLWAEPFFIPMKKNRYELDVNHDGYPEIAVAVWDGGNSPLPRWAVIFTVKEKELVPFGRKKYNIESNQPLLK